MVGSHVPMSSRQLAQLLTQPQVTGIELPVEDLLRDPADLLALSRRAGQQLEQQLQAGRVAVLYTSRTLVTSDETTRHLEIGQQVSHAITTALQEIKTRPRFILAKGGITSHDVAQKGLGAEQALVIGQIFPGIPVWRLAKGPGVRFENVPYIVFPGNVGDPASLRDAVQLLYQSQAGYD